MKKDSIIVNIIDSNVMIKNVYVYSIKQGIHIQTSSLRRVKQMLGCLNIRWLTSKCCIWRNWMNHLVFV